MQVWRLTCVGLVISVLAASCEIKRASGSITTNKANGGDEISVELFQILKADAVQVLY